MAIMWAIFTKIAVLLFHQGLSLPIIKLFFVQMGYAGISINLLLMVLNLVPIPPLDGSRVVASLLPPNVASIYSAIERYGFIILMVLIYTNVLSVIIGPPLVYIQNIILDVFSI